MSPRSPHASAGQNPASRLNPPFQNARLQPGVLLYEGGSFLKQNALTTAILAALKAGATVNEALLLKTESTRLQTQASDHWAFYQAKGLKAAVQEATAASWETAGKPVPKKLHELAALTRNRAIW
jgi:hypothetical protein